MPNQSGGGMGFLLSVLAVCSPPHGQNDMFSKIDARDFAFLLGTPYSIYMCMSEAEQLLGFEWEQRLASE